VIDAPQRRARTMLSGQSTSVSALPVSKSWHGEIGLWSETYYELTLRIPNIMMKFCCTRSDYRGHNGGGF
jgi:hypothetical protein